MQMRVIVQSTTQILKSPFSRSNRSRNCKGLERGYSRGMQATRAGKKRGCSRRSSRYQTAKAVADQSQASLLLQNCKSSIGYIDQAKCFRLRRFSFIDMSCNEVSHSSAKFSSSLVGDLEWEVKLPPEVQEVSAGRCTGHLHCYIIYLVRPNF